MIGGLAELNNPPDLTFWSGPTDDYMTFAGNNKTSLIWNMARGAGHDTVIGGNALATIDFFIDDQLSMTLGGDNGLVVIDAGSSITYSNVNRWRFWNGDFDVVASPNDESFEIWANHVDLDISSGGSDVLNFTGWKTSTVRTKGLDADDKVSFNSHEFGAITNIDQLNLTYIQDQGVLS